MKNVRLPLHKKENPNNDMGVTLILNVQRNSENGKIVGGEFGIKIGEGQERVVPTMTCGWYRMPMGDIRLNIEIVADSVIDQDRLQKELEPVVEAITAGYLEGLPLSFKVTGSDPNFNPSRGSGQRIIFYTDFATCQRLIQIMKDKGCGSANPRMIQDGADKHFIPFDDKRIHVRASGEGISGQQKQLVEQQLEKMTVS